MKIPMRFDSAGFECARARAEKGIGVREKTTKRKIT